MARTGTPLQARTPVETMTLTLPAGMLETKLEVAPAEVVVMAHAACENLTCPVNTSNLLTIDSCNEVGHFARECPQKGSGGGGLTGECYNCGQVG